MFSYSRNNAALLLLSPRSLPSSSSLFFSPLYFRPGFWFPLILTLAIYRPSTEADSLNETHGIIKDREDGRVQKGFQYYKIRPPYRTRIIISTNSKGQFFPILYFFFFFVATEMELKSEIGPCVQEKRR